MVFCEDCQHLSKKEAVHWATFVLPSSNLNPHTVPYTTFSKICEHPYCFELRTEEDPTHRIVRRVRVKGQAQLNEKNRCSLFVAIPLKPIKKPWYKFW